MQTFDCLKNEKYSKISTVKKRSAIEKKLTKFNDFLVD